MRDFHLPGRSTVYAANGAAATSHPLAARVAIETLQAGGNAVDAAIAGAVLLGVAEPGSTGIGGDMFALLKPAGSEEIVGLNGSGRAPAAADAEALRAAGHAAVPTYSAHAVVVPGAIAGFAKLAADHGRLGLDRALAPAIAYAEEGVPVAPRASWDWQRGEEHMAGAMRRHFLKDDRAYRPGEIFRHPGLAEVMRRIARAGAAAFYEGEIAEDMVASLNAGGGAHTAEDFAACTADYVDPISGLYRGHEIVEIPPNGQGATALLMAGMLEHFDLASLDPAGAERMHLETEAAKIAYAARDEVIADPAYMKIPVEHMISSGTAARLAATIDPARAKPRPVNPVGGAPHRDTIYICVVDRDRIAVSLIFSTFHGFGSGLASEKFGINFNNRAAGFTLEAGHPNEFGSAKRPMHTIIPGFLKKDGKALMPFGVMGGGYQPVGHVRLVSNIVDYGLDPQAALDMTRGFFEDGKLALERGYGPEARAALAAMGHEVTTPDVPHGGGQAIMIDDANGVLIAGSDPRKDGIALGY